MRVCVLNMPIKARTIKASAIKAQILAGVEGVEPANAGIKIRCLNQLGDTPTQDNCQTLYLSANPLNC